MSPTRKQFSLNRGASGKQTPISRKTSGKPVTKPKARAAARAPLATPAVTAKAFASALARIAALEAQVAQFRAALQIAGSDVTIEAGGTLVLRGATIKIESAATIQAQGTQINLTAAMVNVDAGIVKASGMVKCDTLQANAVVASSYTPGAGNIW
jgi:adhesin HecA-like repeat protein